MTLRFNNATYDPVNLTGVQTMSASIKVGSTSITKSGLTTTGINISDTTGGKFSFTIDSSQTSSLAAVASGTLQVNYQIGGSLSSVLIPNAYSVSNRVV